MAIDNEGPGVGSIQPRTVDRLLRSAPAGHSVSPVASEQPPIVAMRRVAALGFVAGYVVVFGAANIGGLYPAPMTGNTTQFAISFTHLQWSHALLLGALIGSFFGGGLISSELRRYVVNPPGELLIMAGLLALAQACRLFNAHPLAIELPILAIAMAMQGETASRFGGRSIQTIVVTNTLLKCADAVVALLHERRTVRSAKLISKSGALADVAIPACAWGGYFVGAMAAAVVIGSMPIPLIMPIAVLLAIALDMQTTTLL